MGNKKHIILSEIATASLSASPSPEGKVPVYNSTTNDFDLVETGWEEDGNFYYQSECPTGDIPVGSFWYDTISGILYVRILQGSPDQYLWVSPSVECCGGVSFFYRNTCPDIEPGGVLPGSLWYNSETGRLSIYIYDSSIDQYVWATPSIDCCPTVDVNTIKTVKLVIPSSSVLTLNSIPLLVVPSPGAGKAIEVIKFTAKMDFNSSAYTNGLGNAIMELIVDTAPASQALLSSSFLNSAESIFRGVAPVTGNGTTNMVENRPLLVSIQSGNPADGDSDVTIYVSYKILEI